MGSLSWHSLAVLGKLQCEAPLQGKRPAFRLTFRELSDVWLVRRTGLEPVWCYPLAPQASASANFATSAQTCAHDGQQER